MSKTPQQKYNNSVKRLQKRADTLLQEINRILNKVCDYCGKECTVGHHYFPKSVSSVLRYDIKNIIPLCNGCHFAHHNGDPRIHANVIDKRGLFWHNALEKKKETYTKVNKDYYEKMILKLEKELNETKQ